MTDSKTTAEPGAEAHFREAMAQALRQPEPTPREQFVADGSLADQSCTPAFAENCVCRREICTYDPDAGCGLRRVLRKNIETDKK